MNDLSENIFDGLPLDTDFGDTFFGEDYVLTDNIGEITVEDFGNVGFGFDPNTDFANLFNDSIQTSTSTVGSSSDMINVMDGDSIGTSIPDITQNGIRTGIHYTTTNITPISRRRTIHDMTTNITPISRKKRKKEKIEKFSKKNIYRSTLREQYPPLCTVIPDMNNIKEYYLKINKDRQDKPLDFVRISLNEKESSMTTFIENQDFIINCNSIKNFLGTYKLNNLYLKHYLINNKSSIEVLLKYIYHKEEDDINEIKNIISDNFKKNNILFNFLGDNTLLGHYICYGDLSLFDIIFDNLKNNNIERNLIKYEINKSKNKIVIKEYRINKKQIISKFIKNISEFKCVKSDLFNKEYIKNIDFIKKNKRLYNYLVLLDNPFNDTFITINMIKQWLIQKNIDYNEFKYPLEYIFKCFDKFELFPDEFRMGFILFMKNKIKQIKKLKTFGLLNHQSIAAEYIHIRKETFIADDMGLGKTASSILGTFSNKSIKNILIICPSVLIGHWKKELNKWSYECNENIIIYDKYTFHNHKHKVYDGKEKIYLIVSHTYFLYNDSDLMMRKNPILFSFAKNCNCIILDEIHLYSTGKRWHPRLVNWTKNINKQCKIIALSGTPIRQRLYEMKYLLEILRVNITHDRDIVYLSSVFRSKTLRRIKYDDENKKHNLITLPPIKTNEVYLPLDKMSKGRYNMINEILWQFRHDNRKTGGIPLATFSVLRRLCVCFKSLNEEVQEILEGDTLDIKKRRKICDRLQAIKNTGDDCSICLEPLEYIISKNSCVVCTTPCGHAFHENCINECIKLTKNKRCPNCRQLIREFTLASDFYNQTKKKISEKGSSSSKKELPVPKFEWILKYVLKHSNKSKGTFDKVIVFSEFIKPLQLLKKYLDDNNINSGLVVGNDKYTSKMIETFKNDSKMQVLLATKKCSVGLNLVVANRVIFISVPLSVNIDKQSKDRINRIGQTKEMEITYLITEDSFEVKLMKQLKEKTKIIDDFYKGKLNVTPEQFEKALTTFQLTADDLDDKVKHM